MDYGQGQVANAKYQGAQTANVSYPAEAAAPQSMSDSINSRLQNIRANFADLCVSADAAANKIVGSAPTPIASGGIGQIKGERPPATSFLDGILQIVNDLENLGRDTQEHLNRIHRQF